MSFREENVRIKIETVEDLTSTGDKLERINQLLAQQVVLFNQLQGNNTTQQVASINAVTTALNAQQVAAAAVGTSATAAGNAATTANNNHKNSVDGTKELYKELGDSVRSFRDLVLGAFALNEIKNFGADVIEAKTKIDSLKIALDVMLGSKKESAELFSQIVALAKTTPFSLDEVAENVVKLKAYNIATKDLIPTVEALGNIAAAVGKDKLPQLTLAYGQVMNFGKLMGTELRQFTEAGVPLFDLLATSMGKTRDEVIKLTQDHQIMATDVAKAIREASEAGGKYYNLMALQAKTLGGEVSNLGDVYFVAKARIGDYFEGSIKSGIRTLADLLTATIGSNSAIDRTIDIVKAAVSTWVTYNVAVRATAIAEGASAAATSVANSVRSAGRLIAGTYYLALIAMTEGNVALTASEIQTAAAAEAMWVSIGGPIGAIVIAIGVVTSAYLAFQAASDEVVSSLGEQEIKLRTEESNLNVVAKAALAAGEGTKQRKEYIDLLIQRYPQYFSGLDSEKTSNAQLKNILDSVNESYSKRIDLAREAYKTEGIANAQKELFEKEEAFFKGLDGALNVQFGGSVKRLVETLDAGGASAETLKQKLNDSASGGAEFFGAAARSIAGQFTGLEKQSADSALRGKKIGDEARAAEVSAIKAHYDGLIEQAAGNSAKISALKKQENDEIAKANGTFQEAVTKTNQDTADKTKQITLLSAAEISAITKGANAETLKEKLSALNAEEKVEIESVNKRTVAKNISASALAALERQAQDQILAIHIEYDEKRAALTLKYDTEERQILAAGTDSQILMIQARVDAQRGADGLEAISSFNRTESYKQQAKELKATEKEIQDARKETLKVTEEAAKIEKETREKTINSLVQIAEQYGGLLGQIAGFTIKVIGNIDLLSGKTVGAAKSQLESAQFTLDTVTKMYGDAGAEGELKIAKAGEAVANSKKSVAEASAESAQAAFTVFGLAQTVLTAVSDAYNKAQEAMYQAVADSLQRTQDTLTNYYTLVKQGNKEALDAQLADTRLSYGQRMDIVREFYTNERTLSTDQQRIQSELTYYKAITQAGIDWKGDVGKLLDDLSKAKADKLTADAQAQIAAYQADKDEAAKVLELKKQMLSEELTAYKATKQAEIDALTAKLEKEKQLNAQNSSDDQLRLQGDDVFRRQLLDAGEAREVAALEAAKQRELVRAKEKGASAEEVSRITIAFDQLIADKHSEYQTAIGNKSKEVSLANQEAKAQEADKVTKLEAATTAGINSLKDQIAAKDAETNRQLALANAFYNESVRRANYDTFAAQIQLFVSQVQAEIAILKAKKAPAGAINDLIAALNQISGQSNPFEIQQYLSDPGQLETVARGGKAVRADNYQPISEGETGDGKKVEISFNPTGKRITVYLPDPQNPGIRLPVEVIFADGYVPETGQRFFEGTDYVNGPAGIDRVPAMLTQGERVLTTAQNQALSGITNQMLVEKVKSFDLFAARYPQLLPLPGAGAVLQLPAGIMNANGGTVVDMSEVVSKLSDVHSALKNQKHLAMTIDKNGFSAALIGVQSKTDYVTNLMTR